jgi:hypothetical protein
VSLPTGALESISLPTGLGSAAATGLSGFELARRKAQFGGMPSLSFSLPMGLSLPTASLDVGGAAPTGFEMPSFSLPAGAVAPTGTLPGVPSGVALPTAGL